MSGVGETDMNAAVAVVAADAAQPDAAGPLRHEAFSIEHLEEHARALAAAHRLVASHRDEGQLWETFEADSRQLEQTYDTVVAAVRSGEEISPGAEWLLDNFYIVREQLREIREDLPRRFYRELPKLASGPHAGAPRVYSLAVELIAHTDSALDAVTLTRFIRAYQQSSPLTIGEIWAVPIMLRLALVDNLRRLGDRIAETQTHRRCANTWANWIIDERPRDPAGVLAERTKDTPQLDSPLVAQMVQRFRDQGHDLAACWQWLEKRMADEGRPLEDVVREEHQRQACDQVSTGNAITSMRLLSAVDWSAFFEETSLVEQQLRSDPAGVYPQMDFATRDAYRHVVERLARRSKRPEVEVAARAVAQARNAADDTLGQHVGYYLVDEGLVNLEREVHARIPLFTRLGRAARRHALAFYLGSIALIWAAAWLLALVLAARLGARTGGLVFLACAAIVPASELAVLIVNYLATLLVKPRPLARMDFKEAIPDDCRVIVVIPTLLLNEEGVATLLERLEIHWLANPDAQMRYALLTDFADADEQHRPEDDALLDAARRGIAELNAEYPGDGGPRFYLFHRARRFNPVEGKWMGWERKRGKISEFNRLLRGAEDTSYLIPRRLPPELAGIRYVITLDTDTRLPLGAARKLVSTMAHPLNTARLDRSGRRVVRGYSILQPRIGITSEGAQRSRFARLQTANPHVDPYVTAVSDAYQDLFGEGSFTGKGIYDVDAFEHVLGRAFPENRILSHDLIEGCLARAGLVTDVELLDDFPSQYHAYARRQHRWTRGDWQLLPWLLPRVPTAEGSARNPLSGISRWKIFDNLRRSLVAPSIVALLVGGWFLLPRPAWIWTVLAVGVVSLPLLTQFHAILLGRPHGVSWRRYARESLRPLTRSAAQTLVSLAFLPHQAYIMVDAICRTLVRVLVTRRHLLEWETAYATERRLKHGWRFFLREMWTALVLAGAVTVVLAWQHATATPWSAVPLLALWLASPPLAFYLGRPERKYVRRLSGDERRKLRLIARRTWLFFETFVREEDHWLPPDNYQEHPRGVVAHRTSPTNEGLFLVSVLVAHDFGYVGLHGLANWLDRNLGGWDEIEQFRGHPYNWYDTQSLLPLPPTYISTVDSGNLAASALALRQGLLERLDAPIVRRAAIAGLTDALALVQEALDHPTSDARPETRRQIAKLLEYLGAEETADPPDVWHWNEQRARLEAEITRTISGLATAPQAGEFPPRPLANRLEALAGQLDQVQDDIRHLFPWLSLLKASPSDNPPIPRPAFAAEDGDAPAWLPAWREAWRAIASLRTLRQLAEAPRTWSQHAGAVSSALESAPPAPGREAIDRWLDDFRLGLESGAAAARDLIGRYEQLAERLRTMALDMNFNFLYDAQRSLFSIGYNVTTAQLDRSHYDLLASEARLASFFAIGKGEIDFRHWFHLGRPLTHTAGMDALLSWGGTMFEYLMPNIFLRPFPGTLLEQSCRAAVERQIEYGRQRGVPWGISESAFAAVDGSANYQYRSFGVPGLGLKRGLADDLVVAPYATGLALLVDPHRALENFRALETEGGLGPWGFFDAIDYTPSRVPAGERQTVVRCYFAHHQGMLLAAVANCLLDNCLVRRFHGEAITRATELLLQERIPVAAAPVHPHGDEVTHPPLVRESESSMSRWLTTPHTASPRTHLLSNGKYMVMVTNAGGGYSDCRGTRITRWHPDTTCDAWGQYIYLRDVESGELFSATYQPTCREPDDYEVLFSADKAEFRRRDGDLETHLEIAVPPDTDIEVRLLSVTNHGQEPRQLEVTSYVELVLGPADADAAHPAFQKLSVQTELVASRDALIAFRRPRSADEPQRWGVHVLAVDAGWGSADDPDAARTQHETDRARFIGRGRTLTVPAACDPIQELTGTTGPVLDPIFSLRRTIEIPPGQSVKLAFSTGFAASRDDALTMADQYHDLRVVLRAFELAWAHAQVELRHIHLSPGSVHHFQRLASLLLYPDSWKRAAAATLAANRQGQSGLWRYGISGDYPILLARVTASDQDGLVRELLLAHERWRSEGFTVELVLLNEHPTSYVDAVNDQLNRLVGECGAWAIVGKRGGIFVLHAARMPEEDRTLLLAAAHVVLHGAAGTLERQLETAQPARRQPPALVARPRPREKEPPGQRDPASIEALQLSNGIGGFSADAREYVIQLGPGETTPAPWTNVIANPTFGCLVTDAGLGSTWAENSRENRLSSWSNDPVVDPPSEAVYVRDDETGETWTISPSPLRDGGRYSVRHGQGYTTFEHTACGIAGEMLVTVAPTAPVKIVRLRLRNATSRPCALSATYCVEWVLGVSRDQSQLHVITSLDPPSQAMLATNAYNQEFAQRVAFLHVLGSSRSWTADRQEFFGRNRGWHNPAALGRVSLSGRTGASLDPCGALQTRIQLEPGQQTDVYFLLGQGENLAETKSLIARLNSPAAIEALILEARQAWDDVLGTIQVHTPDPALDALVNRWLLYQTLSCRFWGRTAFYQSGGAFGFRDQLQDSMALVYSRPDLVREHLLRAAARQFEPGDVQHWWHPPSGRGVRTRFSDDYLWLPLAAAHYLSVTGDQGLLNERVAWISSPLLAPEEQERYELPQVTSTTETFFVHCLRAIEHGLRFGSHGLPLMGCGDWNDGMNRVGAGGRGESVWVGWFLIEVIERFVPWIELRGDRAKADELREQAARLRQAIEEQAWDGGWYRRAYFDDGTPLGTASGDACQIDSLAQSWAVFAGGDPARARMAMEAVQARLVRDRDKLVLLFWPPFDHTALDPGYIKGYLPGVRENGGQYTHAALWVVQAAARLGHGTKAAEWMRYLLPTEHTQSAADLDRYRSEPYVVAADIYSTEPHVGRGGWTWYTGSAAWMYRVAVESLLGLQISAGRLRLDPCIPAGWKGFEMTYVHGAARYVIRVENPSAVERGVAAMYLNGAACEQVHVGEPGTHEIRVVLG